MAYETILYERKGKIATVTLNRPEKFNTIRPPMPEELEKGGLGMGAVELPGGLRRAGSQPGRCGP